MRSRGQLPKKKKKVNLGGKRGLALHVTKGGGPKVLVRKGKETLGWERTKR